MEQKKLTRTKMPEIPPEERIKSFIEVACGYPEEQAIREAKRCIQCKKPTCIFGCPVEINIPKFIKEISEGNFQQAINTIKEKNNLPAICGRVCPQETQCELKCIIGKKGEPVAIGSLERFVADWQMRQNVVGSPERSEGRSNLLKKVAVIGSGPAGLTCAGDLARSGFSVTIFEALHEPGGVLRYGIPTFRLPREILEYEINYVKSLGVEIICNTVIGKTFTLKELFNMGYSAIFIGTGAGLPTFPNIPGENLCRIYSANEFLTRINLMSAHKFPEFDTPLNIGKRVAVIGGGNTAMDAARCALRLGSDVSIIYRRTEQEMPARRAEIEHAKEEGINFLFLLQPIEFLGDSQGFVTGIKCLKCELGQPDSSGRRKPIPIKGSDFVIPVDTVILALGLNPNPLIPKTTPELKTNEYGDIIVNPETMETSIENVYAGGDIVGGEGTVIEAMGMGKKAAKSIIEKLNKIS
ncbi:MAG: NADPH-dependent glutamate synthase [Endomicrobiia bacterium]